MLWNLFAPFVTAAYHLVRWLASLVEPLAGAQSAAVGIILLTIAVRALLHPLVRAQVRGEIIRAALAPEIRLLRDWHGKDVERMNKALAELYARLSRVS